MDICQEVACPYKAGTIYNKIKKVVVPKLKGKFYITIAIATRGGNAEILVCSTTISNLKYIKILE